MAETFGQCWDPRNALDITWGNGPLKGENDATTRDQLRAAIPPIPPMLPGTITINAELTWTAASAVPLAVECATVDATKPDFFEIWAGMQTPSANPECWPYRSRPRRPRRHAMRVALRLR